MGSDLVQEGGLGPCTEVEVSFSLLLLPLLLLLLCDTGGWQTAQGRG
jgi:hypothetical protein